MIKGKVEILGGGEFPYAWYITIGWDYLTNQTLYKTRKSALRAAKRVADKLGIPLEAER